MDGLSHKFLQIHPDSFKFLQSNGAMMSGSQQFESVILSIKTGPIPFPKNDSHHMTMTMPTMNPSSHCLATGCASTLNPGRFRYPQQAGPSTPAIDPNQAWAANGRRVQCNA